MKAILLLISVLFTSLNIVLGQVTAEAELGTVTGATISTDGTGYSGTGYVVFSDAGSVEVTVNMASAGLYELILGYRSAYGEKTQDLKVNDVLVESVVFPLSENFTTLDVGQVNLKAGDNKISIVKNWGYMDLDYFLVQTESVPSTLPIANAGTEQVKMDLNHDLAETFTLDASGSSDPDNDIVSYKWYTEDGTQIGTGVQISYSTTIGSKEITLKVEDATGNIASDKVKIFVGDPSNNGNNRIQIRNGRQAIFANGINLAWNDFAGDIVSLDTAYFSGVLDSIENAGGNAMRWWLHTNGKNSPQFDAAGNVTGVDVQTISNMRTVLDMAYKRGIMVSMCLWSFDMLQEEGQDQQMMKNLLEDKAKTQTYIDNALIPILEEIGNHPAVLTWEIFNEPEGMTEEFGWTPVKSKMQFVQQFINLTAGAIHRTVPEALVSNGSWSFKASTDKIGNTNYYRDDRLVAAGGDEDGTLDFYQVHYYPENFGNELSPFHRPADWWGLNKPIVVGEFPTKGIEAKADPHYTITEAYNIAYNYGYAGAMAWDFRGFDGGSFETAKEGIADLTMKYPEDIVVDDAPDLFNNPPVVIGSIPNVNLLSGTTVLLENYVALDTIFTDIEDGASLTYSIAENTNPDLAVAEISETGVLNIAITDNESGIAAITVKAKDSQGASAITSFYVNIKGKGGNLALFKPIYASTEEVSEDNLAEYANDGSKDTRWSSLYEDEQWIYVDLEEPTEISLIKLYWETAFGKHYEIQISNDADTWETIYTESSGNGGEDVIDIQPVTTRYVRMHGIERGSEYGFSLFEFEIYNPITTGVLPLQNKLWLYPNPVKSFLNLEVSGSRNVVVDFIDILGNVALSRTLQGGSDYTVDVSNLNAGLYFIKITSNNATITQKIIKL